MGRTEVCEFEFSYFTDQKVLWLQISVQYMPLMTVRQATEQLKQKQFHILMVESTRMSLQVLTQIRVHVLEDKSERIFCMNDVVKGYDIRVFQTSKK